MTISPGHFILRTAGVFILVVLVMISFASFVPENFPEKAQVRIPKESSLSEVSSILARNNIITSPFLFTATIALLHGQRSVVAGDYLFSEPQNLWKVARRLARGSHGFEPVKITIPEGSTVQDIAWILLKKIPDFNAPYFVQIAHNFEGYLFPDTYLFYPNQTPTEVFKKLRDTFDTKFEKLSFDIQLLRRSPREVVIMASLLEKEAATSDDRAIIAGILWKRLDEGMLLQVDAPLVQITGDRNVSIEDTKIDSPYNTYKYKGLPKGPIANPGLDSLKAAVHPLKTPYYYYLSDPKGKVHYATTHAGHVVNKEKYLR